MAAGVSPPLEERIEDDQHGKRNHSLVEKNCADRLTQLHGVHLPEDRRSGEGAHMSNSRLLPNLLRVGFWESLVVHSWAGNAEQYSSVLENVPTEHMLCGPGTTTAEFWLPEHPVLYRDNETNTS